MYQTNLKRFFIITLFICPLIFTACDNDIDSFLEETSIQKEPSAIFKDTIVVVHWNIGHFSLGKAPDTTISTDEADNMTSKYKELLDSVNADILGICEYNPTFSVNGDKTSSLLFNNYPFQCIGPKYSYNCNAIFSRTKLHDTNVQFYKKCVQERYYIESRLIINMHDVYFVETHLDWNQGTMGKGSRTEQISELVNRYKDTPYVIICGDMNIASLDELQPVIEAGFSLANRGEQGVYYTYPASKPYSSIDHIIVKGFKILDVKTTGDARLSDHLLIKCILQINH